MQKNDLSRIWNEYTRQELSKKQVDPDPFIQFEIWMNEALSAEVPESTAMTLATVSSDMQPSARIVLLKDFDHRGFTFYTNYESRKAHEILANPKAALVFHWKELERQVRIEGSVQKVTEAESDAYFNSRPEESRLSAIISRQSRAIPDRAYLEKLREDYLNEHPGDLKRPDFWGGFRVLPHTIEFWQGRPGRLHDRIRYILQGEKWLMERLAP